MAENEKIEWVGCQWMMQGYCGRKTPAQQAENETRPVEAAAEPPVAPAADAVEPPAPPAKAARRKAPRRDAWSAARKEAAAKRRRRPAA